LSVYFIGGEAGRGTYATEEVVLEVELEVGVLLDGAEDLSREDSATMIPWSAVVCMSWTDLDAFGCHLVVEACVSLNMYGIGACRSTPLDRSGRLRRVIL